MPVYVLDPKHVGKAMSALSAALSGLEPENIDAVAVQAAIGACYVLNMRFILSSMYGLTAPSEKQLFKALQSKVSWEYAVEVAEEFVGKENLDALAESYGTTTH